MPIRFNLRKRVRLEPSRYPYYAARFCTTAKEKLYQKSVSKDAELLSITRTRISTKTHSGDSVQLVLSVKL